MDGGAVAVDFVGVDAAVFGVLDYAESFDAVADLRAHGAHACRERLLLRRVLVGLDGGGCGGGAGFEACRDGGRGVERDAVHHVAGDQVLVDAAVVRWALEAAHEADVAAVRRPVAVVDGGPAVGRAVRVWRVLPRAVVGVAVDGHRVRDVEDFVHGAGPVVLADCKIC